MRNRRVPYSLGKPYQVGTKLIVPMAFYPKKPAQTITVTFAMSCRGCEGMCDDIEKIYCDPICGRVVWWTERKLS